MSQMPPSHLQTTLIKFPENRSAHRYGPDDVFIPSTIIIRESQGYTIIALHFGLNQRHVLRLTAEDKERISERLAV